jgi:hypothetical protein
MSNLNVPNLPTNATCCGGGWNVLINATCCVTCCDGAGGPAGFPRTRVNVVGLIIFPLLVTGLCLLAVIHARLREKQELALAQAEEDLVSQESKEESRQKRIESISNGLIVKEWVPPEDPPVESTEGDQDTSPSSEAVRAPHIPAPPINYSSPASCAMGSDDCESLAGEEEMAGCAICLSHFKPQQLVCESNNSSCQHVFHKDCMVDWLMKRHDNCPMCREVYLLKTV